MSLFSSESIKLYSESIGITGLSDEVLTLLTHDTEYRVREILQEAGKFMRHAKRSKLSVADVNYSLALKHVEPIYGYDPMDPICFKALTPGSAASSTAAHAPLYYVPDKEIDFDSILLLLTKTGQPPGPCSGQKVSWTSHWLAIEGVQPAIAENPPQQSLAFADAAGAAQSQPQPLSANGASNGGSSAVEVRHALSKEHQLYFETVTNCLLSKDAVAISTSLASLKNDAGIQQLLPYFVQYLSESVIRGIKDLELLRVLLQTAAALLFNSHLFLEPYLHQLMPTLLTLAIGKRLGLEPEADHWTLRDNAAELIKHIVLEYGSAYPNLAPRVLKTLLKVLLAPASEAAAPASDALVGPKYGAVATLKALGNQNVELFILPNLEVLSQFWRQPEDADLASAFHLKAIVTQAVGSYFKAQLEDQPHAGPAAPIQVKYAEAVEILGDALVPFVGANDMQT